MPGFGSGPFGRFGFGSSAWARSVLFDLVPSIYRQLDEENDNALETLTDAIGPSLDAARERIDHWRDLRNALAVRTKYNEKVSLKLGIVREPDSPIEQRGFDGTIDGTRAFTSTTARFRPEDLGKTLLISESGVPINNTRVFKIASVISPTKVRCDPPLITDAGPLRWVVKGFPTFPENQLSIEVRSGSVADIAPGWVLFDGGTEFSITRRSQFFPMAGEPRILTEREGPSGKALSDGRFEAEVAFSQRDVGKPITISESVTVGNNGKFEIYKVDATTPTRVTLHEPTTVPGVDANGGITYTLKPGNSGVRIEHLVTGVLIPLSVSVRGDDITVFLQTDIAGAPISTAAAVAAAVTAHPVASTKVTAAGTGTGLGLASAATFTLIPGICLAEDVGPLHWAVLPYPELRVVGSAPPDGVVEQENVDLEVTATPNQVYADAAKFTAADVGKLLTIRGSALGNDGVYTIATIVDAQTCTVTASPALTAETDLTWEVRTESNMSNVLRVEAFAPSLIENLAADFALTVDDRETEAQQRSWVENSVRWMDLKGSAKGYEIIGAISGFNAEARGLYRIKRYIYGGLPSINRYIFGETAEGRFGTNGRIFDAGAANRFVSPTATFKPSDVGLCLYLENTASAGNTDLFEITAFVNSTTVELDPLGGSLGPDNGVGGTLSAPTIEWRLARLYADRPPEKPRYDDLNVELMQDIVGEAAFRMDYYCWDPIVVDEFTIGITSVSPSIATGIPIFYTVTVTGLMQGTGNYSTARVIGVPSTFQITDAAARTYYVESSPILTAAGPPESHTFQVFGAEPPAIGTAVMKYICTEQTSCDYCRAHVAAVLITEGAIAGASPAEVDAALAVVTNRLQNEVRPEHVQLVPIYFDGLSVVGESLNPDIILLPETNVDLSGFILTETGSPIAAEVGGELEVE